MPTMNPYLSPEHDAAPDSDDRESPVISALAKSRPWVVVLAVFGFGASALSALFTAAMVVAALDGDMEEDRVGVLLVVGELALATLLSFGLSLLLARFAGRVGAAESSGSGADVVAAIEIQSRFFRLLTLSIAGAILGVIAFVVVVSA